MRINLGSLAFNMLLNDGKGNPDWGTPLGQKREYYLDLQGVEELLTSMIYNIVDVNQIDIPLGKGGKQRDQYDFIIASHYPKVCVNGNPINGASFVLLVIKQLDGFHKDRRIVKYSPRLKYQNESYNDDCFKKIREFLGIQQNAAWFISGIDFPNQDTINFTAHVVDKNGPLYYENKESRNSIFQDCIKRDNALCQTPTDSVDSNQYDTGDSTIHGLNKRNDDQPLVDPEYEEQECYPDVHHYTSLESGLAILAGIKNKRIEMRATRCDCLNDPNEVGLSNGDTFPEDALPYILSFCRKEDSQVMWRLYDAQLVFRFSRDVIETDLEADSCQDNNDFNFEFGIVEYNNPDKIAFYKDSDWEVESEYRVVASEKASAIYSERKEIDRRNTTSKYGLVKLFRTISLPANSLKGIRILASNEQQFKIIKRQIDDLIANNKDDFDHDFEIIKANCAPFRK